MYELTTTDKAGTTRTYCVHSWTGKKRFITERELLADVKWSEVLFSDYDDVYADHDAVTAIARECLEEYDMPVLVPLADMELSA